ncbi:MAG: stage II sporulation protein M [Actinomycetota bacterium]|nr:stage II sporulation protein M [Actinomycetota bacterium]
MNLDAFLHDRAPSWQALEDALARAKGHPERLGAQGVLELGRHYRAAAADLAIARRQFPGDPVVDRLERLVLAGRQAVYSERPRLAVTLREFFTRGYWTLVAGRPGTLGAAALAMFGPCLLAAVWAVHDPGAAIGLVPTRFKAAAHPHVHTLAVGAVTQAALASSIFTNNIQVTFLTFAGGLALGLGTFAVLAFNGVLVGALAGLTIQSGSFSVFVRYVVPHGLLELSCITVCGAAGLRLAWAVAVPGTLPRGQSLRREARPAVAVVLGTAPWLVVAGLTEGFVTPRGLALPAALAVGLGLAAPYWLLVITRGRAPGTVPVHRRALALARR